MSTLPQNLVTWRPGNHAQEWCFVLATALTSKPLDLVYKTRVSCPFPCLLFFLLTLRHVVFSSSCLFFSQIFSKFKGFQLGVYKFLKNDKIFLLESLLLPGLIVIISWEGSRFFSFICSVCQVAFLFEHALIHFAVILFFSSFCHCRLQIARQISC